MDATMNGEQVWRSFRFRPPDPLWAPAQHLKRVRAELAAFDGRVTLWWSPYRRAASDEHRPGRWRVMEWMPNQGSWATAFYWEGSEGEYREPHAGGIIVGLQARACSLTQLSEDVERQNLENLRKKRREFLKTQFEHYLDLRERDEGIRQTFAPGYIRRRSVKRRDLANTNHQRWLREVGAA